MTDFVARLRQRLYPVKEDDISDLRKAWSFALGLLCILALFTATNGRMYSDAGWSLNGIPVSGYVLWVLFNVYLGIGVVSELLAPRDEKTRSMSRGLRWSLAALALISVTVSIIVVCVFPGAGPGS